jgi:riboflavin synthase
VFTGIIEEIGIVEKIVPGKESRRFRISAQKIMENLSMDSSVSVNGVCMTVTQILPKSFETMAMSKTLQQSLLGQVKKGSKVNLERALRMGDRLGGHLVQGHVDGIGRVIAIRKQGDAILFSIQMPEELLHYVILRGSVAVNGVSLTVAELHEDRILVSVIPHTFNHTTLQLLKAGSLVNVETDLFGKYVERLLKHHPEMKKNSSWMPFAE